MNILLFLLLVITTTNGKAIRSRRSAGNYIVSAGYGVSGENEPNAQKYSSSAKTHYPKQTLSSAPVKSNYIITSASENSPNKYSFPDKPNYLVTSASENNSNKYSFYTTEKSVKIFQLNSNTQENNANSQMFDPAEKNVENRDLNHDQNPDSYEENDFEESYNARPDMQELNRVVSKLEKDTDHAKPKYSKIVQVIKVPAVYEVHLQSEDNPGNQHYIHINQNNLDGHDKILLGDANGLLGNPFLNNNDNAPIKNLDFHRSNIKTLPKIILKDPNNNFESKKIINLQNNSNLGKNKLKNVNKTFKFQPKNDFKSENSFQYSDKKQPQALHVVPPPSFNGNNYNNDFHNPSAIDYNGQEQNSISGNNLPVFTTPLYPPHESYGPYNAVPTKSSYEVPQSSILGLNNFNPDQQSNIFQDNQNLLDQFNEENLKLLTARNQEIFKDFNEQNLNPYHDQNLFLRDAPENLKEDLIYGKSFENVQNPTQYEYNLKSDENFPKSMDYKYNSKFPFENVQNSIQYELPISGSDQWSQNLYVGNQNAKSYSEDPFNYMTPENIVQETRNNYEHSGFSYQGDIGRNPEGEFLKSNYPINNYKRPNENNDMRKTNYGDKNMQRRPKQYDQKRRNDNMRYVIYVTEDEYS